MVDAFHNVLFPIRIAIGSRGGPVRRTEIVQLSSGAEQRTARWSASKRQFNAGYGVKSIADIEAVLAFFEAREGRRFGFRWRDPMDSQSSSLSAQIMPTDQEIGTGDSVTTDFQLKKTYSSGAQIIERVILLPVEQSVQIAVDGTLVQASDYSADSTTGVISFSVAPAQGATITAGYQFDVLARFDTDELIISVETGGAQIPQIPITEVLV